MVLVPVLYNHYNPITQQYFRSGECLLRIGTSTGLIIVFVYTHKSILSVSPGETPIIRTEPRICAVRFSPEETPTIRTEPRNCAVIFSPGGNTHQPNRTAQLHSVAAAGLSGASQIACLGSGKPPTRRTSLPWYSRLDCSS